MFTDELLSVTFIHIQVILNVKIIIYTFKSIKAFFLTKVFQGFIVIFQFFLILGLIPEGPLLTDDKFLFHQFYVEQSSNTQKPELQRNVNELYAATVSYNL